MIEVIKEIRDENVVLVIINNSLDLLTTE